MGNLQQHLLPEDFLLSHRWQCPQQPGAPLPFQPAGFPLLLTCEQVTIFIKTELHFEREVILEEGFNTDMLERKSIKNGKLSKFRQLLIF
jgi:hypothetical protein